MKKGPYNRGSITGKGHDIVKKLHDKLTNAKEDLFASMNSPVSITDGKRLFLDRVNQSDAANLHPVDKDPENQKGLLQGRNLQDYSDKTKLVYKAPPIVKSFPKKHSFVHNQIANKTKTNNDHLTAIIKDDVLNSNKYKILQELHE